MSSIICFRSGNCSIMMADSLGVSSGVRRHTQKIHPFQDGLVGCVGAESSLQAFLSGARNRFDNDTILVVADHDGFCFVSDSGTWERFDRFSAFGWYADAFTVVHCLRGIYEVIHLFGDVVHDRSFFYTEPPILVGICSPFGSIVGTLKPDRIEDFCSCLDETSVSERVVKTGSRCVHCFNHVAGVSEGTLLTLNEGEENTVEWDKIDIITAKLPLSLATVLTGCEAWIPQIHVPQGITQDVSERFDFSFIHGRNFDGRIN